MEEDWFNVTAESKLNKKIDALQTIVEEQSKLIQQMSEQIKQLKTEHQMAHHISSQNDRTHQLLEELKVIKQRELNMMLREKIPAPFYPLQSSVIPTPFCFKQDPPNYPAPNYPL
jgi:DNA gyrase/topoisomerase IV subunit A